MTKGFLSCDHAKTNSDGEKGDAADAALFRLACTRLSWATPAAHLPVEFEALAACFCQRSEPNGWVARAMPTQSEA